MNSAPGPNQSGPSLLAVIGGWLFMPVVWIVNIAYLALMFFIIFSPLIAVVCGIYWLIRWIRGS